MAKFGINSVMDFLEVFQAAITTMAIIIGSFWTWMLFVKHRQKYPRARLTQDVLVKSLSDVKNLLRVTIRTGNIGEVLIKLKFVEVTIQQVIPAPSEVVESVATGNIQVPSDNSEIEWTEIGKRTVDYGKDYIEIEPGESDEFYFDYIIEKTVKTVLVYCYFKNESKKKREIGWTCTTMHDIESVNKKDRLA